MRGIREKKYQNYHNNHVSHFDTVKTRQKTSFIRLLWRQNMLVFSVALLVFSVLSQVLTPLITNRSADLTPQMRSLTGESRDDTGQYLKSEEGGGFSFAIPESTEGGQSEHTGRVADAYSTNLSADPKDGITVTEKNSKIAVTLIPEFYVQNGQKVEGDHIVYPTGPDKLVYTLKYNGLKEDIIVPEYRSDELSYTFTLRLPAGVEARLDNAGNIGIYSSDPTLFGDISFGSDEDREKIEKARQNGAKNNLVMTIPFPVIKDSTGTKYTDRSNFELSDQKQVKKSQAPESLPADAPPSLTTLNQYQLTINARQLDQLQYPIAIDPTMQVNDASNFEGVTPESGVDTDISNSEIRRSSLTGGTTGAWSAQTSLPVDNANGESVVYNNFLYYVAGHVLSNSPDVYVSKIQANGTLTSPNLSGCGGATWCQTTSLAEGRSYPVVAAYNGYMYVMGGNTASLANQVEYAKINSDGSIGAWSATSNYGARIYGASGGVYNGYLYVAGGAVIGGAGSTTQIRHASINANGSVGTWSNTSASLPLEKNQATAGIYNGYFYHIGGTGTTVGGESNEIDIGKIEADGDIGSFTTTTFPIEIVKNEISFHAGYIYSAGGCTHVACATVLNTVRYAEVYGDGSLGGWKTSTNLPQNSHSQGFIINGDYLYSVAGCSAGACSTRESDTYMSTIKHAGELSNETSGPSLGTARWAHTSVTYNGYVYAIGGCTTAGSGAGELNDCNTPTTSIEVSQIASDGKLGTWGTTGMVALPAARWLHEVVAYNGWLYLTGGCTDGGAGVCTLQNTTIRIQINATNGQMTGSWTTDDTFTSARREHKSVAIKDYLYILGGHGTGTTSYSDVQKSAIASDGSIGTWSSTTSLPKDIFDSTDAQVQGDRIYIIGGTTRTPSLGGTNTIYYNTVGSSGNLGGSWTTNGTTIPTTISYQTAGIHNGHVYVIASNTHYYGQIASDGSVGTFTNGASGQQTFATSGMIMANGMAHNIGGCTAFAEPVCNSGNVTGFTSDIVINNGGNGLATSASATVGSDFTTGKFGHDSVVHNGYIYVAGGRTLNCPLACSQTWDNSIKRAPLNSDGTTGTWVTETNPIPDNGRYLHQMVQVNGYMYIIGGQDSGFNYRNTVLRTSINPDTGALGSWTNLTGSALPTNLGRHQANVFGNDIVVTGGQVSAAEGVDEVYHASVDASGNLSSWAATTSLPNNRRMHQAVEVGNMLIVTGGIHTNAVADIYRDAIVADVASDGTVSAWRRAGELPAARHSHIVAAGNGFLYFGQGCYDFDNIGQCSADSVNDVWVTSVSSDGSLGSWKSTEILDAARAESTGHVVNGRFYSFGGCRSGCDLLNEVSFTGRFFGLASIPRIGSFTRAYDFGSGVKPTKLITRGSKPVGARIDLSYADNAACGATAYDTAVSETDIGYTGSNALDINIGATQTLARCLLLRYTIDDTQSAVFPDAGNESTITDFDLYFTANPGQRLRGGRTFINGQDRGLDAAPQ